MSQEEFQEVKSRRTRPPFRKDVLTKVANGDILPEEADKMLRTYPPRRPRFVVTRSGKIALNNLQKDPIVLYVDQWEKLADLVDKGILKTFIERNENVLKRRPARKPTDEEETGAEESNQ